VIAGHRAPNNQREFSRLAITGRGEPATRVIHAVRELNHARADPIHLIALHTETERDALFVRQADKTACLEDGALEHVLRSCRADALWARPELASDHGEFAKLCDRLGIVLAGPDPAALRRLCDEVATEQPARTRHLAVSIIADLAAGGQLQGDPPAPTGHAVETHLRADAAPGGVSDRQGRSEMRRATPRPLPRAASARPERTNGDHRSDGRGRCAGRRATAAARSRRTPRPGLAPPSASRTTRATVGGQRAGRGQAQSLLQLGRRDGAAP
jgi:Biotin carboxylase, N-terminal domain